MGGSSVQQGKEDKVAFKINVFHMYPTAALQKNWLSDLFYYWAVDSTCEGHLCVTVHALLLDAVLVGFGASP